MVKPPWSRWVTNNMETGHGTQCLSSFAEKLVMNCLVMLRPRQGGLLFVRKPPKWAIFPPCTMFSCSKSQLLQLIWSTGMIFLSRGVGVEVKKKEVHGDSTIVAGGITSENWSGEGVTIYYLCFTASYNFNTIQLICKSSNGYFILLTFKIVHKHQSCSVGRTVERMIEKDRETWAINYAVE